MTDEALIKKVRAIPKTERGRIIQRAIEVYLESDGGREVCELFKKENTNEAKDSKAEQRIYRVNTLQDVLGDY